MVKSFRSPSKIARRLKLMPLAARKLTSWPRFMYNYALGLVPDAPYAFRNRARLKIGRGVDHVPIIEIFLREDYGVVSDGAVVLDLGANIGLTALHYSAMWPEACVCAVEMDQENFDMCVRNFPGVSIHAAVGVRAGAGYYAQEGWEARYSLTRPGDTFVRVLTIGQIIDECLPTASGIFCKMDIEGAEWDIFAGGGIDARITHLLVELHGPDIPKEEVKRGKRMLANSGFETTRHVIHPSALWAVR